jgi:membrane protein
MGNPVTWSFDLLKRLNHIIWHTPLSELSRGKTFLLKQLRIIMIAARGFSHNKVQLRASALTYYTLLSVIPIAAIAFGIAKGFGLDNTLEGLITRELSAQKEVLNWLLVNAQSALSQTRGGYIAGIGLIILLYAVMAMLERIESSFNHIWQIRSARPWYRKFTDYLTIMLIAPIFIILSSSLTVFISTQMNEVMENATILEFFKPVVSFLFKFAPYLLSWISLTILFIVMPNTKVELRPALISGIIAGTLIQILQYVYLDLQFGITKLSAIYGSFAAIPLFILWIQSNWIIVLLGAELSFANQNVSRYEYETEALNVSTFHKRALVILIMNRLIRNFETGEKPLSAGLVASGLRIPVRLARDILQDLKNVNLVSVVHEHDGKEQFFQPAIDINILTVSYVLKALDRKGGDIHDAIGSKDFSKVVAMLEKFDKLTTKSNQNILIKDL